MQFESSCYKKWKANEILSDIRTTQQANIPKLANVVVVVQMIMFFRFFIGRVLFELPLF